MRIQQLLVAAALFMSLAFVACNKHDELNVAVTAPDFSSFTDVTAKKAAFFDYLLPIITAENNKIIELRLKLRKIESKAYPIKAKKDKAFILDLAKHYKIDTAKYPSEPALMKILLRRVDVVPPSMALAQAAKESGWGVSRFAIQGNNFFGQWCYQQGCGMVPKQRKPEATHEVARFETPALSVGAYFFNINTASAYTGLRQQREKLRSDKNVIQGYSLAANLDKYSERRGAYVSEIRSLIKSNKLAAYDQAYVTPAQPLTLEKV